SGQASRPTSTISASSCPISPGPAARVRPPAVRTASKKIAVQDWISVLTRENPFRFHFILITMELPRKMAACPTEDVIVDMIDGRLPQTAAAALHQHLDHCT